MTQFPDLFSCLVTSTISFFFFLHYRSTARVPKKLFCKIQNVFTPDKIFSFKNCNHKGLGIYYLLSAFIFGISGTKLLKANNNTKKRFHYRSYRENFWDSREETRHPYQIWTTSCRNLWKQFLDIMLSSLSRRASREQEKEENHPGNRLQRLFGSYSSGLETGIIWTSGTKSRRWLSRTCGTRKQEI
jgi:hypothetical protein